MPYFRAFHHPLERDILARGVTGLYFCLANENRNGYSAQMEIGARLIINFTMGGAKIAGSSL